MLRGAPAVWPSPLPVSGAHCPPGRASVPTKPAARPLAPPSPACLCEETRFNVFYPVCPESSSQPPGINVAHQSVRVSVPSVEVVCGSHTARARSRWPRVSGGPSWLQCSRLWSAQKPGCPPPPRQARNREFCVSSCFPEMRCACQVHRPPGLCLPEGAVQAPEWTAVWEVWTLGGRGSSHMCFRGWTWAWHPGPRVPGRPTVAQSGHTGRLPVLAAGGSGAGSRGPRPRSLQRPARG